MTSALFSCENFNYAVRPRPDTCRSVAARGRATKPPARTVGRRRLAAARIARNRAAARRNRRHAASAHFGAKLAKLPAAPAAIPTSLPEMRRIVGAGVIDNAWRRHACGAGEARRWLARLLGRGQALPPAARRRRACARNASVESCNHIDEVRLRPRRARAGE